MKIANQQDFVSGCIFVLIGSVFSLGAWFKYPLGSASDPGAGYFSFGLGAILFVLGGLVVFNALGKEVDIAGAIGAIAWRPIIVILASVAAFGYLLPRLGLLVALPSLVIASSLATVEFRLRDALISAVVLTAASYGLFVKALSLNLPVGIFN